MSNLKQAFLNEQKTAKATAAILGILDALDEGDQRKVLQAIGKATGRDVGMTSAEKKKAGWYSDTQAFGPRNLDC